MLLRIAGFALVATLLLAAGATGSSPAGSWRQSGVPAIPHLTSYVGSPAADLTSSSPSALPGTLAAAIHTLRPVVPSITSALTIIYPNGTISNHSAPIAVSGNTYTLTGNFTGGIEIDRGQITLRGNGHTLRTDLSLTNGVLVNGTNFVTVRSLFVQGGQEGIAVVGANGVQVFNDRVNGTTDFGVNVQSSANVSVDGNIISSYNGIFGLRVNGFNASGNTVANVSTFGILVEYGTQINVFGNHITTTYGSIFVVYGGQATVGFNDVSGGWYGFYSYSIQSLVVEQNNISNTDMAILLDATSQASISGDHGANVSSAETLYSAFNVTLDDEQFPGTFYQGLDLEYSSGINLTDSDLSGAAYRGAFVAFSSSVTLRSVDLSDFGAYGFGANSSEWITLDRVNASNSSAIGSYGFYLNSNLEIVLANCTGSSVAYGLYANGGSGLRVENSSFVNETQYDYAGLIISFRDVTFRSDHFSNESAEGLYLESTTHADVEGSIFANISDAALVSGSCSQMSLVGNRFDGIGGTAVALWSSNDVTVRDNVVRNGSTTYSTGFQAIDGSGLVLSNNTALGVNYSFNLEYVANLELVGNNGSDSYYGVYLYGLSAASVLGNTFENDLFGFAVGNDFGVTIAHNDFLNDSGWQNPQSTDQNTWDLGYPGGGNFWGNWTGPDNSSGPGQNLLGPDGIVDSPFNINASNVDQYPLARAWTAATVIVTETGLDPGTEWSANISGTMISGTGTSLAYAVTNGANQSLPYTIAGVAGYQTPTPNAGAIDFAGADVILPVSFTPFTYGVTFDESGLMAGTSWNVTFDGHLHAVPGANLTTSARNGTYNFSVAPVAGYALTTPSGSVVVAGSEVVVAIAYDRIIQPVVWNNQTVYDNQTIVTNHTVYRNGTNGSGGNNGGGNNGGTNTGATTTSGTPFSPMVVYSLVAAVVALACLAALGFALWSRARGRTPPAAAQAWTPPAPAAAPSPPPAAVGKPAAPPAPAAGGAVASAPDWSEDP